jgi:hypothetical protein
MKQNGNDAKNGSDKAVNEQLTNQQLDGKVASKWKKLRGLVVGFAILIILFIGGLILHIRHVDSIINQKKIASLVGSHTCSDRSLASIKDEKPNKTNPSASIALISYRANCSNQLKDYSKAITYYQQLYPYYKTENNSLMIASISTTIYDLRAIENPVKIENPAAYAKEEPNYNEVKGK